jgi:LmbE family N-acetylglucosaminyl deacetylase
MEELVALPESVLAVFAHPDDPDVAAGGTLARCAAAGAAVDVVICTAGEKGSLDPGTDAAVLARRREEEARAAGAALGVRSVRLLGHPDGELDDLRSLRRELVALVRELRPAALVCPDPLAVFFGEHHYNHRDHRAVGWAALDAVAPDAGAPLYQPEAGPPHQVRLALLSGSLEPNVWVDVRSTIDRKVAAVRCHASQLVGGDEWYAEAVRVRAAEAGRPVGAVAAEVFRRVRLGP